MLQYALAGGYFLVLVFNKLFKFKKSFQYLEYLMLFLVLGLISDFALNRQIRIFYPSVDWFSAWLVLVSLGMIGFSFRQLIPRALNFVVIFLLGTGLVAFGYFAFYLAPFYLIGLVGALMLGLGLHVFIPVCAVFALVTAARRMYKHDLALQRTFLAGILLPLLAAITFLVLWYQGSTHINQTLNHYQTQDQQDLPKWLVVAQKIPVTPVYERIIKSDLVYQTASERFDMFDLPTRNFDETLQHDPLVVMATRFFQKPELQTEERIKILESMYDARHLALDRLWSGQHLTTSNVITQAQIFPEYRMSYTEKILNVHNSMPVEWSQEEAIYTFHLPVGSVVTSLSLWINGKEEKGYLTTQSKADSAYNTIVGVEVRDPSVVHWQEGNTVSVRVFPCTPQENRQFKLGITSPLKVLGNQLQYQNIYFDGPSASQATETTVIRLPNDAIGRNLPSEYKVKGNGRYERFGEYQPDWRLQFPVSPISPVSFNFRGNQYHMQAHVKKYSDFTPTRIYLDINKAWTQEEIATIVEVVKGKPVYVFQDSMIKLTNLNKEALLASLRTSNFTLFPLHLVKDPENALIISKGNGVSPNLQDIKESRFSALFSKSALNQQPVRFFHLGQDLTPYIKTLKELRLLRYDQGTTDEIVHLLKRQKFVLDQTDANTVVLGASGTQIKRTETSINSQTTAPDHLMRLFAYNHLLHQIGPNYFKKGYLEENLIAEAAQANVVSPLSSLVVLEKQEDYERFGIEENKDALGNATMKSSGAVPEPHEWALIILVVLVVFYTAIKPRFF